MKIEGIFLDEVHVSNYVVPRPTSIEYKYRALD